MENIDSFKIIGIQVQTSNLDGQAGVDLSALWGRFYGENIPDQILNKLSDDVYGIYTDYETDYKGKYTCVIGQRVDSLDNIPEGLVGREFEGGQYQKFLAKGEMPNAIVATWQEIWAKDEELNRTYTADFEVYGLKSQDGDKAEADIFIACE